jgi:hypothetical protein
VFVRCVSSLTRADPVMFTKRTRQQKPAHGLECRRVPGAGEAGESAGSFVATRPMASCPSPSASVAPIHGPTTRRGAGGQRSACSKPEVERAGGSPGVHAPVQMWPANRCYSRITDYGARHETPVLPQGRGADQSAYREPEVAAMQQSVAGSVLVSDDTQATPAGW